MERRRIQTHNHLLDGLPAADWARLQVSLDVIDMPPDRTLCEPGTEIRQVYFPVSCDVSLLMLLDDGAMPEIAMVGCEGMVGVAAFMGGMNTPGLACVRTPGQAYVLSAAALRHEFERGGALRDTLLRYTNALMTQIVQVAICNGRHSVHQRLGRWLLSSVDTRHTSGELAVTQEQIANLLGVRREGVTAAAGTLQRAGHIRYSRGRIALLDRTGLEGCVCECYRVIRTEFDKLLASASSRSSHA